MPIAEPFTALGAGNGFPFCAVRAEMSFPNITKWTTLGGYNSDSTEPVTEEQINTSLIKAMELYWLYQRLNCDIFTQTNGYEDVTLTSVSTDNFESGEASSDLGLLELLGEEDILPKRRVCYNRFDLRQSASNTLRGSSVNMGCLPIAMFNNGEFVGYGAGSSPRPFASCRALGGTSNIVQASVSAMSYTLSTESSQLSSERRVALTEIPRVGGGSYPCVGVAFAQSPQNEVLPQIKTADAVTLSAYAESLSSSGDIIGSARASLESIDLYTINPN